ncbi:hypothetical protein GCM10027169_12710 [Gordonia jinhuaensis]|uniref:DUF2510 domain-containing protein n=1 Tax=Gordonia jinhuaensis TaxID=1517702 RepID=A0A916SXU7_9ACTN|nr:DUF2510 domain-containing protein [Gordonia jinhuaensis]GGB22248.1 hypothetical protein GCM10011489_08040 [Gordonia jinhuaensis]
MTQPTPPSWLPDPEGSGRERWWDGYRWTAQTRITPKKNRSSKAWWWIGGFIALVVIIGAIGSTLSDTGNTASPSGGTPSTDARGTATTSTPVDPQADASQSAAMSSALAEATAREQDKTQFKDIGDRDWQLIAKNPDAHLGEKVVIYGKVTQADSVTGDKYIRVSTGAEPADYYTVNTIAKEGVNGVFANVVEGDLVTMWARVWGSKTYDTTLGGSTTAPEVKVNVIEVTGHE